VPDVALAAAGQNGYLVYTTIDAVSGFNAVGGTSAATPSFAGLMALIVQQTGQRQGNANPTLYQLGNSQYSGMGAAGFHDIQTGNNSVPGVTGFSAGPGYDEATGLGSVDAFELVNNWAASISLPVNSVGILTGRPSVFTATVTNPFGTGVSWSTTAGATIVPGSPSTSATFTASEAGTYVITAAPSGALSRTATITVEVHDANLLGSGQTVTGLDVLDLLGHFGSSGAAFDLNGDGVVDQTDLTLLVSLLGWN
jgi:subtilase family serine protease